VRQPSLKELAAKVCERQPATLAGDRRRAIIAAREAAFLPDFRHALQAGRLVVCCNCAHFTFNEYLGAIGHCEKFNDKCAPFAPFWCAGYSRAAEPVALQYLPETP
jgi:hypothetical protein